MTDRAPAAPFHAAIEAALKDMGRDKAWLSRETGVARSTIHGWKINPQAPRAKSVNVVADALGMDRAEAHRLAGLTSASPASAQETAALSEVDTDTLFAEVSRLMTEIRRRIQR